MKSSKRQMLAFQAVDDAKPYLLPASAVQIRLLNTVLIVGSTAKCLRTRLILEQESDSLWHLFPCRGLALLRG